MRGPNVSVSQIQVDASGAITSNRSPTRTSALQAATFILAASSWPAVTGRAAKNGDSDQVERPEIRLAEAHADRKRQQDRHDGQATSRPTCVSFAPRPVNDSTRTENQHVVSSTAAGSTRPARRHSIQNSAASGDFSAIATMGKRAQRRRSTSV